MRKIVKTDKAPAAIGPYSQAVIANGFLFASGQIPIDPQTNEIIEGGIKEQTEQVLKNITALLQSIELGLDRIVKTTVFLADMNDFTQMNEIYSKYFKTDPPARSTIQAARLPRDVRVEIEIVALV
jgi:2-iminobutanoate/2-iminopropanoate deaminase